MELTKTTKAEVYIYFDPQNPEFCKKMTAKYGEDWNIDDFFNDTSDDFITPTASSIRVPKLPVKNLHRQAITQTKEAK